MTFSRRSVRSGPFFDGANLALAAADAMKMRTAILVGLILLVGVPLGADERITIAVKPVLAVAPATVRVRTRIEANRENRAIQIVAESSDFYRSSEIPLDGERAPRTTIVEFRNLPGGTYNVTAVLIGGNRSLRAVQQIKILSRHME